LLVLDEPTVGVDPQSRNAIFDCLETLKRDGRSLIYTSHYMEEVERLADHIVIMDHGRVITDATPAQLYARLPATASLNLELADPPTAGMLAQIAAHPAVSGLKTNNLMLSIELHHASDALGVMVWLNAQGYQPVHFETSKARLEDVFLTLTGRSLRD
jgi:ABC-2 type transport system ATP-binding protein